MNQYPAAPPPAGGGSGLKIPILFGSVIALLAANIYLYTQLDSVRTDFSEFRKNTLAEITSLKESSSVSTQTARRSLTTLKDELEAARRQAAMAAGQARADAQRQAETLAKQLAAEQARQEKIASEIKTELKQVGEVATTATAKITEVNTEVGNVKNEVTNTKAELEKTVADLRRVRGDLTDTGVLVATNGKELQALKALGERNYFEFNLAKSKQPQQVGGVSMLLKKADQKRNRFTIELIADDKKVEKKDRNINEPLQFYVAKARQPYEIVVNEVAKDRIVGYLATPKVQAARN
jgi:chromosome segregation ATPase